MSSSDPDSPDVRLLQRYRRASDAEPVAPTPAARAAILAEGRRIAALNRAARQFDGAQAAANQPRWKLAAFGTCAAGLLAVLLIAPRYAQRPDRGSLTSANLATPVAAKASPEFPPAGTRAAAQIAAAPAPAANGAAASSKPPQESAATADAAAARRSMSNFSRLTAQNYAPPAEQKQQTRNLAAADQAAAAPPARATALFAAISSADRGQVLSLLEQGAAVDQADDLGRTPLMLATQNGQLQIVQLLLQRGADPQLADGSGRTALQQARLAQRADIVKLLEAAGAR